MALMLALATIHSHNGSHSHTSMTVTTYRQRASHRQIKIPGYLLFYICELNCQYFEGVTSTGASSGLYAAQDAECEVLRDDVIRNITAPAIVLCGSRVFYKFVEVYQQSWHVCYLTDL